MEALSVAYADVICDSRWTWGSMRYLLSEQWALRMRIWPLSLCMYMYDAVRPMGRQFGLMSLGVSHDIACCLSNWFN